MHKCSFRAVENDCNGKHAYQTYGSSVYCRISCNYLAKIQYNYSAKVLLVYIFSFVWPIREIIPRYCLLIKSNNILYSSYQYIVGGQPGSD